MKEAFSHTLSSLNDGLPTGMSGCETYGMTWGCDIDCPVLQKGECELKGSENKNLYQQFLKTLAEDYENE